MIYNPGIRVSNLILLVRSPSTNLKRISLPRASRIIIRIAESSPIVFQSKFVAMFNEIIYIFEVNKIICMGHRNQSCISH